MSVAFTTDRSSLMGGAGGRVETRASSRFFGMRRHGRVRAGEVRKVLFAEGGFLVHWHSLLSPPESGFSTPSVAFSKQRKAPLAPSNPLGRCLPRPYSTVRKAPKTFRPRPHLDPSPTADKIHYVNFGLVPLLAQTALAALSPPANFHP